MKIIDLVNSLFPQGYLDFEGYTRSSPDTGKLPRNLGALPYLCTDLFAIAAVVLQRSGAYHHVAPDNLSTQPTRLLRVTEEMRSKWRKLGAEWRGDNAIEGPPPPQELVQLWDQFWEHREADIFEELGTLSGPPLWWLPTLQLLCIADEAASGLGFEPPPGRRGTAQSLLISPDLQRNILAGGARFSFSTADPDLVCVLPKSRTPWLGCTLRSLSHNVALLPPRGLARAYWLPHEGSTAETGSEEGEPEQRSSSSLNCLLVPMPFRISAVAFEPIRSTDERWGWFRINPDWCPSSKGQNLDDANSGFAQFLTFVTTLIRIAERDVGKVHVLVFPEASLSSAVFRKLKSCLEGTNVELLVAGLFDKTDADGAGYQHGNYAALAVVGKNGLISFRQKHHRWRLDRSQIQTYALGASLDPNYGWWEDIDILSRSLDVYVLRGTTTVTTLICEDLARHDPCQELVRGIGPNLVFALLMDGPQLKARWPARYATVLAEDPGSSVLSLTSLGLVERSNASGLLPKSRSIGLWRDDRGETYELVLPDGAQALCLSLQATGFVEHTLDGRHDSGASESWRLSGIQPVYVPKDTAGLAAVIEGRWPGRQST